MANQQLLDYIDQNRQRGVSDDQIRQALLDAGWPESDVNQGLAAIVGDFNSPGPLAPTLQYALPPAWDLLKQALSFYGSHFKLIFGIAAIPFLVSVLGALLGKISSFVLLNIISSILSLIIGFVSYPALFAAITDINNSTVNNAYRRGLSMLFPFFWIGFLGSLSALGGFVLLIIPGIVISVLLGQAVFILYTEKIKGASALVKSWHYVRGRTGSVFWRNIFYGFLSFAAFFILGLLTGNSILSASGQKTSNELLTQQVSVVGQIMSGALNNLIIAPLGVIYSYLLFLSLKTTKTELLDPEKEKKIRNKIIIFMVIGVLGIIALVILFFSFLQTLGSLLVKTWQ